MTPSEILKEGKLSEAISATNEAVKSAPKDLQHRWFLAELLVIAGELDRADKQLDTLLTLDPRTAVAATPIRQLIRAEAARRQFFDEGRVPEFLDGIHEAAKVRLEAFVALRAGDKSLAGSLVEKAEVARPSLPGKITLQGSQSAFEDIRDLDDISADVIEVLTYTGKYYWIEMSRVQLIEFVAPERPLDLIWRKARLVVRDAFDAEVHLPAVYGSQTGADDASRLGRKTDWIGMDTEAVVGVGRRSFVLNGENEVDIMAIETLEF